ncbi:MAG TPA: hypothetical protein DCX95_02420 [Elusimicrobia bacterium]|nr:hypothetical protein [Elusimicrobiota bacterium]
MLATIVVSIIVSFVTASLGIYASLRKFKNIRSWNIRYKIVDKLLNNMVDIYSKNIRTGFPRNAEDLLSVFNTTIKDISEVSFIATTKYHYVLGRKCYLLIDKLTDDLFHIREEFKNELIGHYTNCKSTDIRNCSKEVDNIVKKYWDKFFKTYHFTIGDLSEYYHKSLF